MNITLAPDREGSPVRGRSPLWMRAIIGVFLVTLFVGGIVAGYLFYRAVRSVVARAELPAVPVLRFSSGQAADASTPVVAEEESIGPLPQVPVETPVAGVGELAYVQPPPPAQPAERINILLLGIDRRGGTGWGIYRTDTIIIVTVDPANQTAGMLSIPRDLQLPIPGNGEDRINTANVWGTVQNYPGGGSALLKRTIEVNFGIAIDYYVMIDFQGFAKIIDTLGGIDVEVSSDLHDTRYPDPRRGDPYAYKTVHFDAGWQHMDGTRALEYARSRMSTTDFDRARRQQQILVAIREKALSLNLIPKLPGLLATMMDSVQTDMSVDEMIELASLVPKIDMDNLKQVVIQKPMVYGFMTEDAGAVQLPKWDLIRPVVADLFTSPVVAEPTPTPAPPTPTPTLAPEEVEELQLLASEGARIAVQNGTSQANFAARVAASLMEQGYQVVEFGDADRLNYPNTVIVDYTGKAYTLERLVEMFQVTPDNLRQSTNLRSRIDIRVIVGEDYQLSLP